MFADRVLDGLGPALRDRAGPVLDDLVDALVDPVTETDQLLTPEATRWAPVFDLDTTPFPGWLGLVTGTAVPQSLTLAEQRAFVAQRGSWRRGTPSAMIAAVKAVLTGSRRVNLIERDGGPWRLTVRTYADQSPSPAAAAAAAGSQKPVGIILNFEVIAGATYAHMRALHGTYAETLTKFPTYADALNHLPEEGTID